MLEQAVGEVLGKFGLGPEGRGVEVVTDVKISIRGVPVQVSLRRGLLENIRQVWEEA